MTSKPDGTGSRLWGDLTTEDFAALDPDRTLAVLPVGAIEQHGPHLPVAVDALINAGILAAGLAKLPEDAPVLVLPAMPVGKSNEHVGYRGTLTLSAETLIRLWTEIGESVARAGVRKLLMFNSHGGQPQIMDVVARDLRVRRAMLAAGYSWYGHGLPEGLFPEAEMRWGIHAGAIETSIMLHLHPELCRREAFDDFAPSLSRLAETRNRLNLIGPVTVGWQAQDLHPSGAAGDARLASAEAGRRIVDHAATALADLMGELIAYPLSALATDPIGAR